VDDANGVAHEHARDFLRKKESQVEYLLNIFEGLEPIVVAPFDAELFGHWWYEGPLFLEYFMREAANSQKLRVVRACDVADWIEKVQILTPAASSWGANGYNEVWLNGTNDWIYLHLHEMVERMTDMAKRYVEEKDPLKVRVLNQMVRELLLAQSSDWAFIMTTRTSVDYAVNRTKTHIKRFLDLYDMLNSGNIDVGELQRLEYVDDIFPDADYKMYLKI